MSFSTSVGGRRPVNPPCHSAALPVSFSMISATARRAASMPWPVSITKSASRRFSSSGTCLARIASNFFLGHAGPRQHTFALHFWRRGHHHDLVDAAPAVGLEEQGYIDDRERRARRMVPLQEGRRVGAHQRMDDCLEPLQRRRSPSTCPQASPGRPHHRTSCPEMPPRPAARPCRDRAGAPPRRNHAPARRSPKTSSPSSTCPCRSSLSGRARS